MDLAKRRIKKALAAGAEIIELRTDYFSDLSVALVEQLIAWARQAMVRPVPLIVTCRDQRQGGVESHPERLRVDVICCAIRAGAEFVDFEYDNFLSTENQERIRVALSQTSKSRLILSAHDFESRFADIKKLYRDMLAAAPAAIPKLVYTANHINDCFDALDLLHQTSSERIVFCMGQAGLISRILTKKLGAFLTFASIDDQSGTASGQLTIEQLKGLYRFDEIDSETELYGVVADPVGHSLSPAIHNACFADKGMNRLYLPLLVEDGKPGFDTFLHNVLLRKWLNFWGFSVTIPHKRNALDHVRATGGSVEALAEKIGAVNTLLIEPRGTSDDRRISAYNTDYAGALDAITAGMSLARSGLSGLQVAVVGAGGVARAIVAGLADAGANVKIYNRTVKRAERLAGDFGCEFAGLDALPGLDAKLLINCTSVGMHPNVDATPVPAEYLNKNVAVFDTVYNPAKTLLLKQAKKKRAKTIDGISMFVNQAMAQFKLFTGEGGNRELMRRVVLEQLR
ncbi:MAG: shikimate dehydrogenase [Phycisphaerales bacterium]|nr:MAG: shikimate dehydrogenase [Phycisphaerales bacterium]